MIKARFGVDFDAVVRRAFPFVERLRIHPDTLTLLGVAVSVLSGAAFASRRPVLAGVLLALAGFFDLIDGVVARAQGTQSTGGAFFDSSMDRVADLVVFAGIAAGMASRADVGGVLLVFWALIGAVLTSYARARAERHLANFSVGLVERGERTAVLILGSLSGFLELALWIVAIGATVTAVQRVLAARRLLRELDATGRDPTLAPAAEGIAGTGGN